MSRALDSYAYLIGALPNMLKEDRHPSIDRVLKLSRAAQIYEVDADAVEECVDDVTRLMVNGYKTAGRDLIEYIRRLDKTVSEVPFPHTPFPVMFVGFSRPVHPGQAYLDYEKHTILSDAFRLTGKNADGADDLHAEALGFLVAETGDDDGIVAWVYRESLPSIGLEDAINIVLIRDEGAEMWTPVAKYTGAWAVTSAILQRISYCHASKQKVTAASRLTLAKRGITGLKAQPYYKVNLNRVSVATMDRLRRQIQEDVERALTFRHDRSGHERLFVHRGELPLSDHARSRLSGRGYSIWEHSDPDESVAELMKDRGHQPKHAREWVATRVVWIEPTVVGSPDLPYVPAVRVR